MTHARANGLLGMICCCAALLAAFPRGAAAQAEGEAGIQWQQGPRKVTLGDIAEFQLPAGYRFADQANTARFMELCQNPVDGSELGVIIPPASKSKDGADGAAGAAGGAGAGDDWFIVFSFNDIGYVKDDEKASLDDKAAGEMLASIRRGTAESNKERAKRGWPAMNIVGWQQKPFYDDVTKNLTWSIKASSEGDEVANYDGRILGRRGVITATMVCSPNQVAAIVPTYQKLVKAVNFVPGHRYAEFRSGDKIAQYGLVGLVTGGTALVVAKSWKGIAKFGVFLFIAVAAGAKKIWGMITGNRGAQEA